LRHGGIDIVISSAAARISPQLPQAAQVALFVNTNNHGTYRMIRAFQPMLNDEARLVVIASSFGSLRHMSPTLHGDFDVVTRSLEEIEQTMVITSILRKRAGRGVCQWPDWINTSYSSRTLRVKFNGLPHGL
jgi:NAD(P)-dependent dehydrogenase (short-subunit alcohol dehydrogenase family)